MPVSGDLSQEDRDDPMVQIAGRVTELEGALSKISQHLQADVYDVDKIQKSAGSVTKMRLSVGRRRVAWRL